MVFKSDHPATDCTWADLPFPRCSGHYWCERCIEGEPGMWRRPPGKKPMERKERLNWDGEFERDEYPLEMLKRNIWLVTLPHQETTAYRCHGLWDSWNLDLKSRWKSTAYKYSIFI
ncbi:hypothetical protein CapIbe_007867 [Capra ibex]